MGRAGVPPGPKSWPIVGAAALFKSEPLQRIRDLAAEFGDVVHYRIGRVPIYLLAHPDDIQSVLVGEHQAFMKDALTHELSFFLGRGLLTSEGSFWRRQRKIAAPTFQRRHIERFADTMVERTLTASHKLADGVRDVHTDMMELTLDIVLHTVFGDAEVPDPSVVGEVVDLMMTEFQRSSLGWRRLLPSWLKEESMAKMERGREKLNAILYGIIRERRSAGRGGDDLLGRLLEARDDRGSGMNDLQLRDEVATIFLAGHETTALTLSFALLLLAENPDIQAQLQAEVDRVGNGRPLSISDVAGLRLVDAVVRESMRLYPPAYLIGREALRDVQIAGWTIPRGSQVLTPQFVVHRDERWFERPDAFEPHRWLDGLAERLPRFAYFPFGGGARVCVGNYFAQLEAVLSLATLIQRIEVRPDPTFTLALMPSVTLRPSSGVRVQVRQRLHGAL